MPDYNIYIHSDPSISNGDRTKPWRSGQTPTSPKDKDGSGEVVSEILNTASNPDSLITRGVGVVTRAIPYVAIAFAAFALIDKTVSTVQNLNAINTGDFSGQVAYNNFKTTLRSGLQPFSVTFNYYQYTQQINATRKRAELSQSLLGESIINSRFGGTKV